MRHSPPLHENHKPAAAGGPEHPEVPLLALSCTLLIMFCGVVDGSCSLLTERSMDFVAGLYETALRCTSPEKNIVEHADSHGVRVGSPIRRQAFRLRAQHLNR